MSAHRPRHVPPPFRTRETYKRDMLRHTSATSKRTYKGTMRHIRDGSGDISGTHQETHKGPIRAHIRDRSGGHIWDRSGHLILFLALAVRRTAIGGCLRVHFNLPPIGASA
eukprot:3542248-Rhodomonas_salina.1